MARTIFATLPDGLNPFSLLDANFADCGSLSANNVWTGAQTFLAGITINMPSGLGQALNTTQQVVGALSSTLNNFHISFDQAVAGGGNGFSNGWFFQQEFGGGPCSGGRQCLNAWLQQNAPANASSTNRQYTAFAPNCISVTGDGGIVGGELGFYYAIGSYTWIKAGHIVQAQAGEFDIEIDAGVTILEKYGLKVVQVSTDVVQGSSNDAAFVAVTQGGGTAPGWKVLLQMGDGSAGSAALSSAGSIIASKVAQTCAIGLDFSNITFTGFSIKTQNFTVDGNGNALTASVTGVAGVSAGALNALGGLFVLFGGTSGQTQIKTAANANGVVTFGTGTGTPAVTASAPLALATATGNLTITGVAGQVLAGSPAAFTATPTLGASGTLGSLGFGNATSGTVTLQPVAGALGSVTASLPANTGTIAELNFAQSWTANQTYTSARLIYTGTVAPPGGSTAALISTDASTITASFDRVSAININNTFSGTAGGGGGQMVGLDVNPNMFPTASIFAARGSLYVVGVGPPTTVTITNAECLNTVLVFQNTAGAVTNARNILIASPFVAGALKPGQMYGIQIQNQGLAGTTTSFAFVIDPQSGSATNYGLYSGEHLTISAAAKTLMLKQGANGCVGTFVNNGATPVTVSNTNIAISDGIVVSLNTVGGTVGALPTIKTITAATGFTVAGVAGDTSTYNYAVIKNAA